MTPMFILHEYAALSYCTDYTLYVVTICLHIFHVVDILIDWKHFEHRI